MSQAAVRRVASWTRANMPALTVVLLLLITGCSSDETTTPAEISGSTVELPPDAVSEAGYEHVETTEKQLNATLRAELEGDIEVTEILDVNATVPISRYRRSTSGGPAILTVAASPSVQLIKNPPMSGDPLSTLSKPELVAFVQPTYTDLQDVSRTATTDLTVAGNQTQLNTYHAIATRDGQSQKVTVSVLRVDYRGDVLTVVRIGPRKATATDRLLELLAAFPA